MQLKSNKATAVSQLTIPVENGELKGELAMPEVPTTGLVLFVHGRTDPGNEFIGQQLYDEGIATLSIDLLTPSEEQANVKSGSYRFDIAYLGDRLVEIIDWVSINKSTEGLKMGLFAGSTGAAVAVTAAIRRPKWISALALRGGRPDLASDSLSELTVPTLLIVGEADGDLLALNKRALSQFTCKKQLTVVPGSSQLCDEDDEQEGLLDVAKLTHSWFSTYLT